MTGKKIKLLVVDDTKFMRRALRDIFESDSELSVVATAKNGKEALRLAKELRPDVITMDIDMPTMDGLTSLKHIMMKSPAPIVLVSALAENPDINFEAWRLGSVEFVKKPSGSVSEDIHSQKKELVEKIKKAALVNVKAVKRVRLKEKLTQKSLQNIKEIERVNIVIGGIGCLSSVIRIMKNYEAPDNTLLIIMLDFPLAMLKTFNKRLNEISKGEVFFAEHSLPIESSGTILVPMEREFQLVNKNGQFFLEQQQSEDKKNRCALTSLPERFYENSTLILLGGDYLISSDCIRAWNAAGGRIYLQTAESCLFPQSIQKISDEKLGAEEKSLQQITRVLSGF